jgi:hypothetical protein
MELSKVIMPSFHKWFQKKYYQWVKAQPGQEDFLGFCDLLGYPSPKVSQWLEGKTTPQGPEVLSIASLLGTEIYDVLGLPQPDPELLEIFDSFSHLAGDFRGKLAEAILEAETELEHRQLTIKSPEGQALFIEAFKKWGLHEF